MEILIRSEEVSKVYNPGRPDEFQALSGVSMEIGAGEIAVLRGPSGSGKTSLLSLIGCMARPTAGRILVEGRDVAKLPEHFLTAVRRQTFGFIFQQFHLIREVSVLENVLLPFGPLETGFTAMRQRGETLLEQLGLAGKRHVKVRQLSGGEQQRVAVARALINAPRVIIADEPTAHLDRELARDLLAILTSLNREGRTILIATHDPEVFNHPAVDRIIEMAGGRIEAVTRR